MAKTARPRKSKPKAKSGAKQGREGKARDVLYSLRLKVKKECYAWLNKAAIEVNQVWNWDIETTLDAADRNRRAHTELLSGYDLDKLSKGACYLFEKIGADTIQQVNHQYAKSRKQAGRLKLRWRKSFGARRSLGWVPFKAASVKRYALGVVFCEKRFRVFEAYRLTSIVWTEGCFSQDSVGDWWLCLPVKYDARRVGPPKPAKRESVGLDLGCVDIAVTSKGQCLPSGRWIRRAEDRLAQAQRRGHRQLAKRIHRKVARCRKDALNKFTTRMSREHAYVFVGDVDPSKLVKTRLAKSVLDAAWGTFRQQLQYKCENAGRVALVLNESNTTRACSVCGETTGPKGREQLDVRRWRCVRCGAAHHRDCNSGINIDFRGRAIVGLRCQERSLSGSTQVLGKEPPLAGTSSQDARVVRDSSLHNRDLARSLAT